MTTSLLMFVPLDNRFQIFLTQFQLSILNYKEMLIHSDNSYTASKDPAITSLIRGHQSGTNATYQKHKKAKHVHQLKTKSRMRVKPPQVYSKSGSHFRKQLFTGSPKATNSI
ncbi:hypothetical protein M9H77_20815 [Catharanthus roseus]|uniref:Uncharacterized protein n=1 Tax=Catharanthus roseus TaxID=4058 RepID=A0ACC0AM35_CATRO|nr:hypothetical protein M9H77_20815 [Catharanthus roseus]